MFKVGESKVLSAWKHDRPFRGHRKVVENFIGLVMHEDFIIQ